MVEGMPTIEEQRECAIKKRAEYLRELKKCVLAMDENVEYDVAIENANMAIRFAAQIGVVADIEEK